VQFGELASLAAGENYYVHAEEYDKHNATFLFVPLKREVHQNSMWSMISIKLVVFSYIEA
jgi:hypothetical protein